MKIVRVGGISSRGILPKHCVDIKVHSDDISEDHIAGDLVAVIPEKEDIEHCENVIKYGTKEDIIQLVAIYKRIQKLKPTPWMKHLIDKVTEETAK